MQNLIRKITTKKQPINHLSTELTTQHQSNLYSSTIDWDQRKISEFSVECLMDGLSWDFTEVVKTLMECEQFTPKRGASEKCVSGRNFKGLYENFDLRYHVLTESLKTNWDYTPQLINKFALVGSDLKVYVTIVVRNPDHEMFNLIPELRNSIYNNMSYTAICGELAEFVHPDNLNYFGKVRLVPSSVL